MFIKMTTLKKSRSLRKIYKRLPSSKVKLHYEKRKPGKQKCANCGSYLHGTLNLRQFKMRNIAKTKKRPERMFGGYLCSYCSRGKIKEIVRLRELKGVEK